MAQANGTSAWMPCCIPAWAARQWVFSWAANASSTAPRLRKEGRCVLSWYWNLPKKASPELCKSVKE